jgi:hypothetical protein
MWPDTLALRPRLLNWTQTCGLGSKPTTCDERSGGVFLKGKGGEDDRLGSI